MVLIEVMSCGKPVIGTRIDGIMDIIRDEEDGYLVSPAQPREIASKINTLLNHPEIMKKMWQLAKEHAYTTFDWNILASRIMEIYQRAISRR